MSYGPMIREEIPLYQPRGVDPDSFKEHVKRYMEFSATGTRFEVFDTIVQKDKIVIAGGNTRYVSVMLENCIPGSIITGYRLDQNSGIFFIGVEYQEKCRLAGHPRNSKFYPRLIVSAKRPDAKLSGLQIHPRVYNCERVVAIDFIVDFSVHQLRGVFGN